MTYHQAACGDIPDPKHVMVIAADGSQPRPVRIERQATHQPDHDKEKDSVDQPLAANPRLIHMSTRVAENQISAAAITSGRIPGRSWT